MLDFYKGKRVFITGHTGFKGSWLCTALLQAGAEVTGFALPPEKESLFRILDLEHRMHSVYGDIAELGSLQKAFDEVAPEIVFHLAAQPIVRKSYKDPVETYRTNVMGTVNLLECVRHSTTVRSVLNVTTDKVYENREWVWGYRESDSLNGFDPYSNSKSCSELVTDSYRKSFLLAKNIAVSTARAGNVIGGGDFSAGRILPDCIRAVRENRPIQLRNPSAVRPYQHVLEPLSAYLLIVQKQIEKPVLSGSYNIAPESADCLTTTELVEWFCRNWGKPTHWEFLAENGPHEDMLLRLDCTKLRTVLKWQPTWDVTRAVSETVAWTKAWLSGQDMIAFTEHQLQIYYDDEKR